jgi:hypothetical protein
MNILHIHIFTYIYVNTGIILQQAQISEEIDAKKDVKSAKKSKKPTKKEIAAAKVYKYIYE